MSAARTFTLTGWHVLIGFTAFFLAIIALDVGFAVLAYRTFPGQQATNPYEAGLEYNRTLAQRRQEAALGWTAEMSAGADSVRIAILDRNGAPVPGLRVAGSATRPATEAGAETMVFAEVAPGIYRAGRPGSGAWDIEVGAGDGAGRRFEAARRLTWP